MNWNEIESRLRNGSANEVQQLKCPECQGSLMVIFTGGRILSLSIDCKKRCHSIRLDGLEFVPPWVAEIGRRFETQ
jgi:hypothetical protein